MPCHHATALALVDNRGSSHVVFKTLWISDPRINVQNDKGRAKAYQVRQALAAIDKLKATRHAD